MNERKRAMGSDLAKVDAHKIMPEEYEEIPELTDDWFARAAPAIGGQPVSKEAWRQAARKSGRPKSANPKGHINLRLDAEVLAHFRATGPGWQSRINAILRKAARLSPAKKRAS
jgi:uncharacterized protein (DUF4415 family)